MNLLDQIKRDEGLRLMPYRDSVGKWTIGYGTNLDAGIDAGEAEYLLSNRLNQTKLAILRALPWVADLDEARMGAIFNMGYNLGVPGLLQFKKTLTFIRNQQYLQAAQEMLHSLWAEQVGGRAVRLAKQIETGEWQ